jgi:hypothetical protein
VRESAISCSRQAAATSLLRSEPPGSAMNWTPCRRASSMLSRNGIAPAEPLGGEGADNALFEAGRDDAVAGQPSEEDRQFGADRVGDRDEVSEGGLRIRIPGTDICAGHIADPARVEAIADAHRGVDGRGEIGAGRRNVLERRRRGDAEGRARLVHDLRQSRSA